MGAALSYYALFAVAPILLLTIGIAGAVVGEEVAEQELGQIVEERLGPEIAEIVTATLERARDTQEVTTITLISLGVTLFTASILFVAWQDLVNVIWKVPRRSGLRSTVHRYVIGMAVVVACGLLLLVTLIAEVVVGALDRISRVVLVEAALDLAGFAFPLVLGAVFLALIYKFTPRADIPWRDIWGGTAVAVTLLSIGFWLYGTYIGSFGMSSAAGVAGSALLLLALVYYGSQILLYGVEFMKVQHYVRGHEDQYLAAARERIPGVVIPDFGRQ